jgi:hypothetical protein
MGNFRSTKIFDGYTLKKLGDVWVDSGTVTITDCVDPYTDLEATEGFVVVPAGYGDGTYPVYGLIKKDEAGFERVFAAFVDFDNLMEK